jgi:endonuclease III
MTSNANRYALPSATHHTGATTTATLETAGIHVLTRAEMAELPPEAPSWTAFRHSTPEGREACAAVRPDCPHCHPDTVTA